MTFTELRAISNPHCLGEFSVCHKNVSVYNKKTNQEASVFFNTILRKCNGSVQNGNFF